ncbi:MAG: NAD-dependent epimerase/dehydratase family protein [Dissulfurimicrobium sp.]|uniref:NAD-dependent epimerase/dehydratase family protein n=1 Tax=Dissulfurimicrobium TaxID=1769732 RepID=UPI001EDBD469|nr:NAD-dependent epimerase/dehydratase family protein [Dissulfurimicrobium hydrothermale]UKL13210.1 NAD-dependent epimerase/dehydratase family protein [Dissulfurimicrobium hydrothermale]
MIHVLITGANGFIGQNLCKSLSGLNIFARGAVRRIGPHIEGINELLVVGEIGPDTEWSCALDGIDIVIHLAGKTHVIQGGKDQKKEFYTINTYGTERLCKMAAHAGVKQFIYLSTAKVHGEISLDRPFSEKDIPAPSDDYAMSKWQAEQVVNATAAGSNMKAVILRPPMVYGPKMKGNLLRLLRLIDAGIPLPFSSINNKRSLLNVANLIDILLSLIRYPIQESATFLVSDGIDLSVGEIIRLLAKALGKKPRLIPCPVNIIKVVACLLGKRDDAERIVNPLMIDSSLIQKHLKWMPPHSIWSGFKDVANWYKTQKNL